MRTHHPPDYDEPMPQWMTICLYLLVVLTITIVIFGIIGCSAKKGIDRQATGIDRSTLISKGILGELREEMTLHRLSIISLAEDTKTLLPPEMERARENQNEIIKIEETDGAKGDKAITTLESENTQIKQSASTIRSLLTGVVDKTPMWLRVIYMALVVLAFGGIIYILSAFGIFRIIRTLLALLHIGVPKRTKSDAKLDVEMFQGDDWNYRDMKRTRERRDEDPAYDVEFKRQKRKLKLK